MIGHDKAVERIVSSLRDRRCLPFIGAGFSAWPLTGLDSDSENALVQCAINTASQAKSSDKAIDWVEREFGKYIAHRKGAPPTLYLRLCLLLMTEGVETRQKVSSPEELSFLAQGVRDLNASGYAQLLHNLFYDCEPNTFHQVLARLPVSYVVTANYDRCYEKASDRYGRPVEAISLDKDLFSRGITPPLLIKIHGNPGPLPENVGIPAAVMGYLEGIILDDASFWGFPRGREELVDLVGGMVACHQTVFLGYGLADFNIVERIHALSSLREATCRPILVCRESPEPPLDKWKSRGIDLVCTDLQRLLGDVWRDLYGDACFDSEGALRVLGVRREELIVNSLLNLKTAVGGSVLGVEC